ncbi:hypothetical protein HLB23_35575 [Nocardia uniformis]|uniref:Secreted protein n=1 Tax=Nocardia uniformis TaxID=53432 RepID=A0A849C8I4_9NOCA|nr:hypothetical protein [Nocardia uniformis]NNH75113.1 hypothetical protein [Nocardia uniformis]
MMIRLRLRRRFLSVGAALCLTGAALAAVASPASAAPAGCVIDRSAADTITFTCPDNGWYVGIVRCLGYRTVGNGMQSPTFNVSDSARPYLPMSLTCNGTGKKGVALDAWTDGPF